MYTIQNVIHIKYQFQDPWSLAVFIQMSRAKSTVNILILKDWIYGAPNLNCLSNNDFLRKNHDKIHVVWKYENNYI